MQKRILTRSVPYPTLCTIIESKGEPRRSRLETLQPAVEQRFRDYQANVRDLSQVAAKTYTEDEKEALEHCYGVNTTALSLLLTSITDAQEPTLRDVCPYCGAAKADTWDHYLPQALFPEFSAHGWNLVPCCWKCNGKKLNVVAVNGQRQIVNFYFDAVPSERFLWTDIQWNAGVPSAEYSIRQGTIDDAMWALIRAHYRRLGRK